MAVQGYVAVVEIVLEADSNCLPCMLPGGVNFYHTQTSLAGKNAPFSWSAKLDLNIVSDLPFSNKIANKVSIKRE